MQTNLLFNFRCLVRYQWSQSCSRLAISGKHFVLHYIHNKLPLVWRNFQSTITLGFCSWVDRRVHLLKHWTLWLCQWCYRFWKSYHQTQYSQWCLFSWLCHWNHAWRQIIQILPKLLFEFWIVYFMWRSRYTLCCVFCQRKHPKRRNSWKYYSTPIA